MRMRRGGGGDRGVDRGMDRGPRMDRGRDGDFRQPHGFRDEGGFGRRERYDRPMDRGPPPERFD